MLCRVWEEIKLFTFPLFLIAFACRLTSYSSSLHIYLSI
jgi:hypothetical protein